MRTRVVWAAGLTLGMLLAFSAIPGGASPDAATVRAIGFRVIERTDASRASKRFPTGRPIQIAFWYPAASSSPEIASPGLTYRDYFLLSTRETSFGPRTEAGDRDAIAQHKALLGSAGVKSEEADFLLATKMMASRDAAPVPGRFPLLLIAQGNDQSAHDQAFLAESLAFRGYTVATVPSQARIGGHMASENDIPAQAEEQATDLAFALRTVRFESDVRPGRYGVVAYSFGARSALLLEMQDAELAGLVSLDGGIGGKAGKGQLEKVKGFRRERATAPMLHFYEEGDPAMIADLGLLRSLDRAERWLVKVDSMRHVHFSSVGVFVRGMPSLAKATSADERTAPAWEAVSAATASFLDRFVADSAAARATRARWTLPVSALLHPVNLPPSPAPPPPGGKPARR